MATFKTIVFLGYMVTFKTVYFMIYGSMIYGYI